MNRILASTIIREAGIDDGSGLLRLFDADTGKQLHAETIPDPLWRARDGNPRGGMRGARGLCMFRDGACLANADSIFHFGPDWKMRWHITNPLMGSIHSLAADARGIFAACVHTDTVVKFQPGSKRPIWWWDWRRDWNVLTALGLEAPIPSVPVTDHDFRDPMVSYAAAWINGVKLVRRGGQERLHICMGRVPSADVLRRAVAGEAITWEDAGPMRSFIFSVVPGSPKETRLVLKSELDGSAPAHMADPDALLDPNSGRYVPAMGVGWNMGAPLAEGDFLRGFCALPGNAFAYGRMNPTAIHHSSGKIPVSHNPKESIFDLCACPDHFEERPEGPIFRHQVAELQALRREAVA